MNRREVAERIVKTTNGATEQGNCETGTELGQSISDPEAVIAIYNTHPEAEAAVKELHRGGFDMRKLSVVGRDYHTDHQVVGYYNAGDRMKYWGKMGVLWGGLWGLLFGAAFFLVPGIGPLLIAGPLSAAFVAALESAVLASGLTVLGAALYSIGIPKEGVLRYETAIKLNKYLLLAHGTGTEVAQAKEVLQTTKPAILDEHVLSGPEPALASPSKHRRNTRIEQRLGEMRVNPGMHRVIGWSVVMSVLMIIAGILAIIVPPAFSIAETATAFIGWLMVFSGAAHMVYAWHTLSSGTLLWGRLLGGMLLGNIYLVAGGYVLTHPMAGFASLTFVLAAYLLLESILEFILSFQLRPLSGSRWLLVEAITNLILAIMIWRTWPASTMWGIGTLVGISMVFSGFTRWMISVAARDVADGFGGELHRPE